MEREPIGETSQPANIQRTNSHVHQFVIEGEQENGLVSYVCKVPRCGYGLLLAKDEDIANYQK